MSQGTDSSRIQAAAEPDGEPDEPDEPAGEPCEPPGWPGDPEGDPDDGEPPGDPRGCGDRDGGGGDGGGGDGRGDDNRETPHCDTASKPPHSQAEAEPRNDARTAAEPVSGVGNAGEEAERGVDLDDVFACITVTDNGRLVPKV